VEWLGYSDRTGARAMPLPRSPAHLKQEISEKKWAEARRWAGGRGSRKKYKMPSRQKPDGTVAGSSKRREDWAMDHRSIASRPCQLKTGHCLTGQHLHRAKSRPTTRCWWCPYRTQTRDHLFTVCPEWKAQQKNLWAEVRKEVGRGKDRFKIRDRLAYRRCSQAVLDSLSTADVGGLVPAVEDAVSEVSEWERRERGEREEKRRVEAEELGAGREEPLFFPTPSFMASAEEE